jgi:phage-related minor tail protein
VRYHEGHATLRQQETAVTALLDQAVQHLGVSVAEADTIYARWTANQAGLRPELEQAQTAAGQFAGALQQEAFATFEGWIDAATQGSFKQKNALKDLLKQVVALAAKFAVFKGLQALFPGQGISFGPFSASAAALGMAYPGGMSLAQGVSDSPTLFRFAKGGRLGLLAEAGRPEAVLPLVRGSGGDLGVEAQAAAPIANVDVQNNASGLAEVTVGQMVDGRVKLRVDSLLAEIGRGGTSASNTFERAYGLRRAR